MGNFNFFSLYSIFSNFPILNISTPVIRKVMKNIKINMSLLN